MAKKFSVLEEKMSETQIKQSDKIYQQMVAEIENQTFEPDIIAWLSHQNAKTKKAINDMVREIMLKDNFNAHTV